MKVLKEAVMHQPPPRDNPEFYVENVEDSASKVHYHAFTSWPHFTHFHAVIFWVTKGLPNTGAISDPSSGHRGRGYWYLGFSSTIEDIHYPSVSWPVAFATTAGKVSRNSLAPASSKPTKVHTTLWCSPSTVRNERFILALISSGTDMLGMALYTARPSASAQSSTYRINVYGVSPLPPCSWNLVAFINYRLSSIRS